MKSILILVIILVPFLGQTQTISAPINLDLNIELLSGKEIPENILDTLTNPMSVLTTSDTVLISAEMIVADTVNLSKIYVKLGSSSGGNDLAEYVFNFSNKNTETRLHYLAEEESLEIILGQFQYVETFFCEIYFEDLQGNNSDIVKYKFN